MPAFAIPEPITATVSLTAADIRIGTAQHTDTTVEIRPVGPADANDVAAAERARVGYAGVRDGHLHRQGRLGEVRAHVSQGDSLLHRVTSGL